MTYEGKMVLLSAAASATQTLPEPAVMINSVTLITGGSTWAAPTKYTIVTGAPAAGQVQFAGNPQNPSATLTFPAALTAGDLLLVRFVPVGAMPAAA